MKLQPLRDLRLGKKKNLKTTEDIALALNRFLPVVGKAFDLQKYYYVCVNINRQDFPTLASENK